MMVMRSMKNVKGRENEVSVQAILMCCCGTQRNARVCITITSLVSKYFFCPLNFMKRRRNLYLDFYRVLLIQCK